MLGAEPDFTNFRFGSGPARHAKNLNNSSQSSGVSDRSVWHYFIPPARLIADAQYSEANDATRHLVWIGVDVTEARLAEKALQQTEILRHSQQQLRTLTAGLVEAQEEERRRV